MPPEDFDFSKAYEPGPDADEFAQAPTELYRPLPNHLQATPSEVQPLLPEPRAVPPTPAAPLSSEASPSTAASPLLEDRFLATPQWDVPKLIVLLSAVLFGLGMFATQWTYGRIIAIPLLSLGLLAALAALPSLESWQRYGFGVIALHALGLLLVLFFPDWLGAGTWLPPGDPNDGPKPALALPRNGQPPRPADRVDATTEVWRQDDVLLEVAHARLEPLDAKAPRGSPNAQPVLRITLKLTNVGVARSIKIGAWRLEEPVQLLNASGQSIPLRKIETPTPIVLLPGKEASMILLFDPPSVAGPLELLIPAAGLDSPDAARFTIPWR